MATSLDAPPKESKPPPPVVPAAQPGSGRLAAWRTRFHLPVPLRSFAAFVGRATDSVSGWVPLTPLGLLAIAGLAAAVWLYSGSQPDLIVLSIGFGGLLVCALDVLVVLAAGVWVRFRRATPPPEEPWQLEGGMPTRTGYCLGLLSWAPMLHWQIQWLAPRGIDVSLIESRAGWQEEITPHERGVSDHHVRRITVRDWLGLARVRFDQRINRLVRCLPWRGNAVRFELVQQYRPGDMLGHPEGQPLGDLVEMRRYVAGDPLKLVLWKAYARTGRMLVRTPERSVSPTDRMLAYLVAAEGDEPAAGICWAALEAGLLGSEVIFMAEGASEPAATLAERMDQIVRSIDFRAAAGASLDRFLVRGEKVGTSAAYLFVSPRTGPWLEPVSRLIESHPGPFRTVIGIDGVRARAESRRWRRWLLSPPNDGLASLDELRAVHDRLERTGAKVIIVNRTTGQSISLDAMTG